MNFVCSLLPPELYTYPGKFVMEAVKTLGIFDIAIHTFAKIKIKIFGKI